MQKSDQFVQVGQVLKSYGTDGSLVIRLYDNFYESPCAGGDFPFWIYFDGLPVPFFSESCDGGSKSKMVVRLTDVNTIEDADELAGKPLYIKVQAGQITGGESESLLDMDLSGWSLYNKGLFAGTVTGIDDIPGNPLLIVTVEGSGEVLIPLHEDLVSYVDADGKALGMSVPEGLLD